MLEKLKQRWIFKSNFQVIVILVVFAITGTTTVYIQNFILNLARFTPETHLLFRISFYVVVILLGYHLFLLLQGQFLGNSSAFLGLKRNYSRGCFLLKNKRL